MNDIEFSWPNPVHSADTHTRTPNIIHKYTEDKNTKMQRQTSRSVPVSGRPSLLQAEQEHCVGSHRENVARLKSSEKEMDMCIYR